MIVDVEKIWVYFINSVVTCYAKLYLIIFVSWIHPHTHTYTYMYMKKTRKGNRKTTNKK